MGSARCVLEVLSLTLPWGMEWNGMEWNGGCSDDSDGAGDVDVDVDVDGGL